MMGAWGKTRSPKKNQKLDASASWHFSRMDQLRLFLTYVSWIYHKNISIIFQKISNLIIDEAIENTSKDTICFRNSDILSARLDRILNPASFENLISQNIHEELETQTVKSNVISDCSHLRTKLKDMRKELEKIEKQYNKIQWVYKWHIYTEMKYILSILKGF